MRRGHLIAVVVALAFACPAPFSARAAETGFMPPDLDYAGICKKNDVPPRDDFNWNGKTPATSGLPPDKLIALAKLYFQGSGETVQNYKRAYDIVEYLTRKAGNPEIKGDALQLKFQMLHSGKGAPKDEDAAKRVLDAMIKNRQPEAYGYYGEIYETEGDYGKAAEYYKKAYALGRNEAAISLAYLYYEDKIPSTKEEKDNAIASAHDSAISYITLGRCNALTSMGLMYDRLVMLPKAQYYSAKWFEKAATLDQIVPKLYLASIIQKGFIIPYDEARVSKLWKEAAALGSHEAMYLLGERAFLSHKSDEDIKEAIQWLERSALRENVRAMEMLANIYDGRYPSFKDGARSRLWLEKAAESGRAKDKTLLALAESYEKDPGEIPPARIFALYKGAAALGNLKAYIKIGDAYRSGVGVNRAPAEALRYYRFAAANGEIKALKALRQAYECGIGIEPDAERAKSADDAEAFYEARAVMQKARDALLSSAAEPDELKRVIHELLLSEPARKNEEAMVFLGLLFGKAGDPKKSESWLKSLLEQDQTEDADYPAHAALGAIYLEGVYAPQDIEQGVDLLKTAARAGNAEAQETLGEWFLKKGDFREASDSLIYASIKSGSSLIKLSQLSERKKDIDSSVSYLERAAADQNVEAMLKLGEIHAPSHPDKARFWFDRALESYPCDASDIATIAADYLEGKNGAPADEKKSEFWLNKMKSIQPADDAQALDIAKAILGSGLSKNPSWRDKALALLEPRANQDGGENIVAFLVSIYLNKNFSGYDPGKAISLLSSRAEKGDAESMIQLANIYTAGYGVAPSLDAARVWLEKAKQAGNAEAERRLKNFK